MQASLAKKADSKTIRRCGRGSDAITQLRDFVYEFPLRKSREEAYEGQQAIEAISVAAEAAAGAAHCADNQLAVGRRGSADVRMARIS